MIYPNSTWVDTDCNQHYSKPYREFSLPIKEDNMPQKFFMVWLKDSPTTQYRHPTKKQAQVEADRIARLPENIGKKVYVLEAISCQYITPSPLMYVTL